MSNFNSDRDALQKKVFTSWVNHYLNKRQLSISDITDGFANGFMLINLVEELWDEPIGKKYNQNPRMSFHKNQNIQMALDFLNAKGVKMIGICAGDISSGSKVLSLTCSIVNGYVDSSIFNGEKGKKGLLNWCKNVANGFKGVNITSMRGTCNGMTFLGVINHFQPSAININDINPNNSSMNAKAIINAYEKLGIQTYLNENEYANLNDEVIITILYLQLYNFFIKKEVSKPGQAENLSQKQPEAKPQIDQQKSVSPSNPQEQKIEEVQKKKNIFSKFIRTKSEKKIITLEKPSERKQAIFRSGNFDKGKIQQASKDDEHLANYINKKYGDDTKILKNEPVLVAKIREDIKDVEFLKDKFEEIIRKAGTRPIVSVAGIGGYQEGKSTTLCGLTGNLGYEVGHGRKETTKGVYADGPYDIDYFYERFGVSPSKTNIFNKSEDFRPVVYFFDIEGYGGSQHSLDDKENKRLYKKLCSPFACISSVFFILSTTTIHLNDVDTIIDALNINKLSNDDELDGNGAVKLIVGIKNYPIIQIKNFISDDDLISQINDESIGRSVKQIETECETFSKLEKYGIKSVFSPMFNPQPLIFVQAYVKSFWYFAQNIIRAIETASNSNLTRDAERNINLFNFIIENYENKNFKDMLQKKIFEEHEKSLERISERYIYEAKDQFLPLIDEQYRKNEEHIEQAKPIESFKKAYLEMGRQKIIAQIGIVEDSPIVARSLEKYYAFINQYIEEKESKLKVIKDKFFGEKKKEARDYADQKLENEISKSKDSIQKLLKQNNYFNFDEKRVEEQVKIESKKFSDYLLNMQKKEMKYLDESIISDEQNAFCEKLMPIAKNMLYNEQKERANNDIEKKKIVEEMVKKQLEINKESEEATAKQMIISNAEEKLYQLYSILEENEIDKLKDDFVNKSFYLQNYKPDAQIKLKTKINESIHHNLMNERNNIIDEILNSYLEKKNVHIDAIKRVVSKNKENIITKQKIDSIISFKSPSLANDITNCISDAKTKLTEYEYEKQNVEDPNDKKILIVMTRRIHYPPGEDIIIEQWHEARRKIRHFKIKKDKTHGKVVIISKNDYENENKTS